MLSVFLETTPPADPNQLMPGLEPEQVSPGVIGFFATFFVVVALAALILDFMRRQRRLRYRLAYAAEQEARENQGSPATEGAQRPAPTATPASSTSSTSDGHVANSRGTEPSGGITRD